MSDLFMDNHPLTAEAGALRDEILAIPRTAEPMMDDVPEDLDVDSMEKLHALAASGSQDVAHELRKLYARFPHFSKLLNYLHVVHTMRGEHRQAEAVLKRLATEHPDYLFTRIALANKALEKKQPERAAAILHPTLSLRDLFPDRDVFHISELKNYYFCVARVLAQRGDPQLARGVQAALAEIDYDPLKDRFIINEIMAANLKAAQAQMDEDKKRRISVNSAPLPTKLVTTPRPAFHHEEIAELYEYCWDLPESWVQSTLSLPRDTLIGDLSAVLEDCIARTPNFMRGHVVEGEDFAVVHALHMLAEMEGHEACPCVLRLLAMHPEAIDFWLGDGEGYVPQFARIFHAVAPACLDWLRLPGIDSAGKTIVTEALVQIAKSDSTRFHEISTVLGELLEFLIDSPPQDNILDTGYITFLVCMLGNLCATEHLPIIRKAYDRNRVEVLLAGDFEEVEMSMFAPMSPPDEWLPLFRQYQVYMDQENPGDNVRQDLPHLPPSVRPPSPYALAPHVAKSTGIPPSSESGRNDPCPCGSGRKFKKCCMP